MPEFLLNGSIESIMLTPFSKKTLAEYEELDAKLRVLGKSQHLGNKVIKKIKKTKKALLA
jgi:hypothetical protein